MSRFDEMRNIARQEVEQRKREIADLERQIAELETTQQELDEEMKVILGWIDELKRKQDDLVLQCYGLQDEIEQKRLPSSLLEKCINVLDNLRKKQPNPKIEYVKETIRKSNMSKEDKENAYNQLNSQEEE